MDDAHIVDISALVFQDPDDAGNFAKWGAGAYTPMMMSLKSMLGTEAHRLVEKSPNYPESVPFMYFRNIEDYENVMHSPEWTAYLKDIEATWGGKFERVWNSLYVLVKRMKNEALTFDKNANYLEQNAPVVLLSGVGLSPNDWEKYDSWFNDWGYSIYIPALLRVPGVVEYSRWWLTNIRRMSPPKPGLTEDPKYPQDLSIIYFENLRGYQKFESSREYAAFRKALAAEFPDGLTYRWNVTYRLISRSTK
jgi:hypothetical protein